MNTAVLSRQQVREVDRRAIDEFGMSGLVLMENAGRGCGDTLERLGIAGPVVIVCGRGNNGGDGFVIARHLDLRGHAVRVALCGDPARLTGDALANYCILAHADAPIVRLDNPFRPNSLTALLADADWIVDALLGTGAVGEPRSPLSDIIHALNAWPAKKIAVDLPSGLDCDTGQPSSATFRADHTCTFVAAKTGFQAAAAKPYLGAVHVLDIGAPRKLIDEMVQLSAGTR